jgi:hypothetical protein
MQDPVSDMLHPLSRDVCMPRFDGRARPPPRHAVSPRPLKAAVWSVLTSLALFFAVDAAIFRSGWYLRYLEPQSTAGRVELHTQWLRSGPWGPEPTAVVLGDSQMSEGFSARLATEALGGTVRFHNAAVPGASARVWYYMLRDVDPSRSAFAALVVPLARYGDVDQRGSDRKQDRFYLLGRLSLLDCWPFASSFEELANFRAALTSCLLPATALSADVKAFLGDVPGRLREVRLWRDHGRDFEDTYEGRKGNLVGINRDSTAGDLMLPAPLAPGQRVPSNLFPPGIETRHRQRWIGAILDLYRHSPTRIIFIQPPQGPWPIGDEGAPHRFLDGVRETPRVTILPPDTFTDLQRPELFFDAVHLNRAGRAMFSERLAGHIARTLQDG